MEEDLFGDSAAAEGPADGLDFDGGPDAADAAQNGASPPGGAIDEEFQFDGTAADGIAPDAADPFAIPVPKEIDEVAELRSRAATALPVAPLRPSSLLFDDTVRRVDAGAASLLDTPEELPVEKAVARLPPTISVSDELFDEADAAAAGEAALYQQRRNRYGREVVHLTGPENVVRAREGRDGRLESNARVVEWDNGDVTIHVGGKTVLVVRKDDAPGTSRLFVRAETAAPSPALGESEAEREALEKLVEAGQLSENYVPEGKSLFLRAGRVDKELIFVPTSVESDLHNLLRDAQTRKLHAFSKVRPTNQANTSLGQAATRQQLRAGTDAAMPDMPAMMAALQDGTAAPALEYKV